MIFSIELTVPAVVKIELQMPGAISILKPGPEAVRP